MAGTGRSYIAAFSKNKEDLLYRKVTDRSHWQGLVIQRGTEKDRDREYVAPRSAATGLLKLPRQGGGLTSRARVMGKMTIGEVDGPVTVSGVDGKVDVAQR